MTTPSHPLPSGRVDRAEIEEREEQLLAPYAMRTGSSRGRVHDEEEHPYRTAYMRDRDRIIHASAFRALEYKTQVFVNHEGDYYRTRLTHTMEVAQISRTVARALRLNEDLTESIALSHDVGHGPFGHKGEYVLRDLMRDHGGFEHNAHGLRVVDVLESRYPHWPGLNLTYEVREAFALHSPRDTAALGFEKGRRPLLEAQVVDLCDNLTYSAHDLDDGTTAGLLDPQDLLDVELWAENWDAVATLHDGLPMRQRVSATVKRIIDQGVGDVIQATTERLAEAGPTTPQEVQEHAHLIVGFSEAMGRKQRRLSHYLHEHFYNHPRLMKMGQKARLFLTQIFEAYQVEPRMLTVEERLWAEEVGLERAICDRLAGLTDRAAQEEYIRLFEPFERM